MSFREQFWHGLDHLPPTFWHAFTWLGDSGLMLPMAVLIAVWLAMAERTRHTAMLWVLLFGSGSVLILASKLAFMGWGIGSARFNFTGFSGHTAISASVWPVALWLTASRAGHRARVAAAVCGWLLAVAIGVSRLALFAHSGSEVLAGLILGVAVSGSFLLLQQRQAHPQLWAPLVALSLMLPLAFQKPGQPAPTQTLLERIAVELAGIEQPYTREDLLRRS